MAKKAKWVTIKSHRVRHIWRCSDNDCAEKLQDKEVRISPDFYVESGTPICECGADMDYVRTEIYNP